MHPFKIAFLVLAASAAAPIFSAPLLGRAGSDLLISNREMSSSVRADDISPNNDDGSMSSRLEKRPEALDRLAARIDMEPSVNVFQSSRGYTASNEAVARDGAFGHSPFSRDNEIQARGAGAFIGYIFKTLLRVFTGITV